MPTTIETVTAFLAECGKSKSAMQEAFRSYFTPTTTWENVGMSATTGIDEALALMDMFESSTGIAMFKVETLSIAATGNRVLTERVDYLLGVEGAELKAVRVMGIFEVTDGRITAWRDYLDTAGFANAG